MKTVEIEEIMKLRDEIKELKEWNAATKRENQKIRIENLNLKEKLLNKEAENTTLRARWAELQELIIQYKEFIKGINKNRHKRMQTLFEDFLDE